MVNTYLFKEIGRIDRKTGVQCTIKWKQLRKSKNKVKIRCDIKLSLSFNPLKECLEELGELSTKNMYSINFNGRKFVFQLSRYLI